jgi:molybdenum cofactor cytidylyltransferase
MNAPLKFAVAILAAGASSRMGRPKLLLPWGETTILSHLIRTWRDAGATEIGVVTSGSNSPLEEEISRFAGESIHRITNPEPERGMFSSVQAAAQYSGWKVSASHYVLALGDQPQVRLDTLRQLVGCAARFTNSVVQPSYNGGRKHPVIFPQDWWGELARTDVATLRDFLNAYREAIRLVDVSDPGLEIDLDTPGDYQKASSLYGSITNARVQKH